MKRPHRAFEERWWSPNWYRQTRQSGCACIWSYKSEHLQRFSWVQVWALRELSKNGRFKRTKQLTVRPVCEGHPQFGPHLPGELGPRSALGLLHLGHGGAPGPLYLSPAKAQAWKSLDDDGATVCEPGPSLDLREGDEMTRLPLVNGSVE
ncbi:hypothetical protein RJZ56_004948 [Blastomyces dermatitidis]